MPLTRRGFLASSIAPFVARGAAPHNVLFIATDDLNNCLSSYGHKQVRTPNLDRLAKSGVRVDRAYCQFPLCSPSRTSLMTGLAPDTTKVYELQTHFRKILPDVVTLGQLFQKNGYYSARVGKIYHYGNPGQIGTSGLDDPPSWNHFVNPAGVDKTKEEPLVTKLTSQAGLGSAIAFHASEAKDEEHTDGMVATETIRLLQEHQKELFFLAAGFYKPHVPWIAPKRYFDLYPKERVSLIPFDERELTIAPKWAYTVRPGNYGLNEDQLRAATQAYFASIAFVDAQIGRVLDALEQLKLRDRTTIVFWSDHGYQIGEHGQWQKQTLFEPSCRLPMFVSGAGVGAKGKASGRTVELLDLYPTLAEMCSLRGAPANLHGRSLAPLLKNPAATWDRPAMTQVRRMAQQQPLFGHSLRTERYRYTMWDGGRQGEELYDYDTDPREMRNLAEDTGSAGVKEGLRKDLLARAAARGMRLG